MADELKTSSSPTIAPPTQPQQPPQFAMDSTGISTVYTNFCHGTITPEELILDFGLNTQMGPNPNVPVKLTHRVVMNFYTAKRLLNFLHWTVNRYESQFGVLETDFQKRVRSPLTPSTPITRPAGGASGE